MPGPAGAPADALGDGEHAQLDDADGEADADDEAEAEADAEADALADAEGDGVLEQVDQNTLNFALPCSPTKVQVSL